MNPRPLEESDKVKRVKRLSYSLSVIALPSSLTPFRGKSRQKRARPPEARGRQAALAIRVRAIHTLRHAVRVMLCHWNLDSGNGWRSGAHYRTVRLPCAG